MELAYEFSVVVFREENSDSEVDDDGCLSVGFYHVVVFLYLGIYG